MNEEQVSRGSRLTTPRAAAIAGILFGVLFIISMSLMRLTIPEDIAGASANAWLQTSARTVRLALTFVPFVGIFFLWFMGAVRSHLGESEDQFFATVFYGSGLLFLAMIFISAALAGGMISAYLVSPTEMAKGEVITFSRSVMYTIMNVYAIRMAGVFMMSLGTIWMRTRLMPRLLIWLTYALAIVLLLAINLSLWVIMVFPVWVIAVSVYILTVSYRDAPAKSGDEITATERP
ncbi:MAG: hypothetical protein ACK2UO_03335 [Caldilineaceae bacterium]